MNWENILKDDEEEGSYSPTITEDEKELKGIREATKSLLDIIKDSNNLRSIWPRAQHTITMLEQLRETINKELTEYHFRRKFPEWYQNEE